MSSACLACHCAISIPLTGVRTRGLTGGTSPALATCARLSMYCRQSRSRPLSHGLCSISNTQASYFDALMAVAESTWAGAKQVSACCPASSARMMLFSRGKSAIFRSSPVGGRTLDEFPAVWELRASSRVLADVLSSTRDEGRSDTRFAPAPLYPRTFGSHRVAASGDCAVDRAQAPRWRVDVWAGN